MSLEETPGKEESGVIEHPYYVPVISDTESVSVPTHARRAAGRFRVETLGDELSGLIDRYINHSAPPRRRMHRFRHGPPYR